MSEWHRGPNPQPYRMTCPHCAGLKVRSCCLCLGRRIVSDVYHRAARWAWHYLDCSCEACHVLKRQYPGQHVGKPRPELEVPCSL